MSRKMRPLTIISFFVASAIATDNLGQPMDYFDDNFNPNLKITPDSKLSFNFEQLRRDQPPQIELREENVGRYIYTRPPTTTPASIFSMKADKESQHVYPSLVPTNNHYHHQGNWNEHQVSSVPPPPNFAFRKPHNNQPIQKDSSLVRNTPTIPQNLPKHSINNFPRQPPSVSNLQSHSGLLKTSKIQSTLAPNTTSRPPKGSEGINFAPSASYVSDSISNNAPRQPPSLPNRGSHKFSWDDIKKDEDVRPVVNIGKSQTTSPSAPQPIHIKPPPPVPTLSPWYDNFGK